MLSKGRSNLITSGTLITLRDGAVAPNYKTTIQVGSPTENLTLTLPVPLTGGTDTLVSLTAQQTLTNKTFTSPVLSSPILTTPQINDTSSDHQYIIAVNELAADRTLTLPLLGGNDTFVFEAHTQVLSNKTLTLPKINDTSADHKYNILVSELAADRDITLPLLGANDEFVFAAHTVTLTNKTIDGDNNTLQDIGIAALKTVLGDADKVLLRDVTGAVTSAKIVDANVDAAAAIADTKLATISTSGKVSNSATTATDANTASAIVARDASGNFTAGTITAALNGNASTATSATTAGSATTAVNVSGIVDPANGGTGIANNTAATLTRSGNHALTLTTSGSTSLTLPTTGTLVVTADKLSALAATTSAELAGVISDETGSGALVFGTAPTLDKPVLNQADITQAASATTPAAGKSAVYVNSGDAKLHVVDSSGNDVAVGSGSSGRNYLGDWFDSAKDIGSVTNSIGNVVDTSDRTANKTTWGSSDTSLLTVARSASSPLRQSYSYAITEAGSSSGAFVESPLFTLDSLDLGKPVTVSFDVSGNSTSDYYQVYICRYDTNDVLKERIAIAGTASATSPYSARLPVGTTNFQGFFVAGATSTDQYALRIVSNNNSADSLKIDSLYVGPESVVQGAAVTDYSLITDITTNFGGTGTLTCRGRQVGDCLELRLLFASTSDRAGATEAQITLPSRLTIDTDKLNTAAGSSRYAGFIGVASIWDNSAGDLVEIYPVCSSSVVSFRREDGLATVTLDSLDTSDNLQMTVLLPIVGWSSNVTMANRAVEEYAYTTDTWDGAGSTTGYGAAGVAMSGALSANRTKTVTWQSPIQSTDKIFVEIFDGNNWVVPGNGTLDATHVEGSITYGVGYTANASSPSLKTDVFFGRYARTNAGTYAGAGTDWTSSYRWRARKISGGASVGYPVSTANVVGRTDGATVGSGYIGERLSATIGANNFTSTTALNVASLSITPGVWLVTGQVYYNGAASTTVSQTITSISATSATPDYLNATIGGSHAAGSDPCFQVTAYVNISATTTYYLVGVSTFAVSTMAVGTASTKFEAVRIA